MYIPSAFAVTDPHKITEIISSNSFGMLVSKDGDSFFASHLPFLYHPEQGTQGRLLSHMARANRHWQLFKEQEEAFVIFNGPHAYISPTSYVAQVAVPTWNYITVHIHGRPRIVEAQMLNQILDETVTKHESTRPEPWTPNLPDELKAKLQEAIVGFEIEITQIEAKFKLGQNRSAEDREKMMGALRNSNDEESIRLAEFMAREMKV